MIKNIWAKTILKSYRYLERIADAIDRMIENRGLYSMNQNSNNYFYTNIWSVSEKLIELSERKIKLINLKILTEQALSKCGKDYANLLISKYINNNSNEKIIEKYKLSTRTFFRKIERAEQRFENVLELLGFDNENLNEFLRDEKWIIVVKQRYEEVGGLKEISVPEVKMERLAVC